MNKPVITFKNVWFSYNKQVILENISFNILENDFIGIIGPNGAGKTTLLKLIIGLLNPNRGEIRIFNNSIKNHHELIGYVSQYLIFDRNFPITVFELVSIGCLSKNKYFINKDDKNTIIKNLNLVEIGNDFLNRPISTLSGGQLQRILIARALCKNPEILILDEPTASVDNTVESNIFELLKKLNKKMTIILVSHDVGFISKYVNKIFCLNKKICIHNAKDITMDHNYSNSYDSNIKQIFHKCGL